MAHFAQLDNGSVVTAVISVHDDCSQDEASGIAFCRSLYGTETQWVQCSYNANIRKQFPGVGYTYDAVADVFVAPQPFPSWTLDSAHDWQPPTPIPVDGGAYAWNEELLAWEAI